MTSALLVAAVVVAAADSQSAQSLDWLVGQWRQPPSASPQWLELTWTATPVGFRGVVERVRNDGTRTPEETYEIEIRDPMKLTWQHSLSEKGLSLQDVFKGSAGLGQHVEFFWVSRTPNRIKRTRDDPYTIQFSLTDGALLIETAVQRHIKSAWTTAHFEHVAGTRGGPRALRLLTDRTAILRR